MNKFIEYEVFMYYVGECIERIRYANYDLDYCKIWLKKCPDDKGIRLDAVNIEDILSTVKDNLELEE